MPVLSRDPGEEVCVGTNIIITVVEVAGNRVRVGIDAPEAVRIVREELYEPLAGPVGRRERKYKEMRHAAGNP